MAENTLPPLPPGFELEGEPPSASTPPLPPGFVLEQDAPALEIDVVPGSTGAAPTQAELQQLRAASPDYQGMTRAADNANDSDFGRMVSGQPREEGMGRDIAMGARSVLQGAGGLLGAIGGDAFNHYLVPGEQPSYREAASGLADRLGLPTPQTSQERVMGDVGEALTGTGLTLGVGGALNAGRNAVSTVAPTARNMLADFLTTQPKLQVLSTATGAGAAGATREAGGGQGAQLAAGLLGGLGPGVGSALTGATTRGLVRGRSGAEMQQTIDDFEALGATPSVGQASGNRTIQGAENLLAGAPTSAGVMNRFAERQADNIGEGLQKTADDFSRNASGERAGRAVSEGVDTFRRNTTAMKRALYWQADRLIPEATPVQLSNTWQTVAKLTTPTPGAAATTGALIQPRISKLRETLAQDIAAGGGLIPYAALKRIRTDIGEAIDGDSLLNPSTDIRELRDLYKALSNDMRAAAQKQGPEAGAAAKRANDYTRAAANRMEAIQHVIDKNGGPEKVFAAAMAGTRDGGTTLRAVMQSLPKEGQEAITAAVIKRMGLANPGMQDAAGDAFSAATFLRKWNDISPEAKRALFDRHGPGFSKDMDRIASVAQNIRDGSKVFANPSGTANRAAALTYGAGLVASLFDPSFVSTGSLAASGAGANYFARKLTDPEVVKWLARSTALPVGAAVAQINGLRRIGEKKGDEEIVALADELARQHEENKGADTGNSK